MLSEEIAMKTFVLLDQAGQPGSLPHNAQIAVWDRGSVPEGQLSIPAELAARILPIRAELAAWTYETGVKEIRGRALEAHLRGEDGKLSLWWCSTLEEKHPKVTINLFPALKLRALELLLNEGAYTDLVLISPDAALGDVLARFCADTGRAFSHIRPAVKTKSAASERPAGRLLALYRRLPAVLQAVAHFGHWLLKVRRWLPQTGDPSPESGTCSVVTYFPNIDLAAARQGRFRSRYWEALHDVLGSEESGKSTVNWVFLYFPSPQCTLSEAVKLRDGFRQNGKDGASFHFLEEFLSGRDIIRSLARFARVALAGWRIQKEVRGRFFLPGSRMDLWPLLSRNWADSTRGWRALERCITESAFERYAAWCGPQTRTLFPQENCPWERLLCKAMHEAQNGPVYGAQHSTVRATDFRYFDDPRLLAEASCRAAMPDLWLCNGNGARDALLASGMPPERLGLVEALRYLYLNRVPSSTDAPSDAGRCLLLVTSFFADEVDAHLHVLAEAVRAGYLQGRRVRIKAHPYLPVQERLKALFPQGDGPEIMERPIGELLRPGVTVWASNSTTVALEAAFRGLPLLVQAAENDLDLCPLQGLPGLIMVRSAADVGAALANPTVPELPPDYLCLDPDLPRWKKLLKSEGKA